MDAELGHPTVGRNETSRKSRILGATLAMIAISALAIGAVVSHSSNENVAAASHIRVARGAPVPTPVYAWNGQNYVITSWDWSSETTTSTGASSSTDTLSSTTTDAITTADAITTDATTSTSTSAPTSSSSAEVYEKPVVPPFKTPALSTGGDKGGKSNISTKKPSNIYAGQTGGAMGSASACDCAGAVVDGTCYGTVAQAVGAASSGSIVSIGGSKQISAPIGIRAKTLSFEGITCGGSKATLVADMDEPTGAILMPGGSEHDITIKDLVFTRSAGSGFSAGLRAYNDKAKMSLSIENCDFKDLRTKAAGGSALYVPFPVNMNVDSSSTFENNIVDTRGNEAHGDGNWFYGGGGSIYILEVSGGRQVTLDGQYTENHHYFQHGLGGAVCVEYLEGELNVPGTFVGNTAADGAGVHIGEIAREGVANVDGVFRSNRAIDYGLGCRGGAVRPWMVHGTFNARGSFSDNRSDGRGAVFATNRLYSTGKINIAGSYTNNVAVGMGTVFSLSNEAVGTTTVSGDSKFSGNQALCSCTNILDIQPGKFQLSEAKFTGQDVTYSAPKGTSKGTQE